MAKVQLVQITDKPIEQIYKAYRICYSKGNYDDVKLPVGTKEDSEKKMLDFIAPLMAEMHTSPLEHVSVTFSITGLSRSALAQITRHRTGKFNVQSQRYVNAENFDYVMPPMPYLEQGENRAVIMACMEHQMDLLFEMYKELISMGVKKEDARFILPEATTCNLIATFDLNNLRKFFAQRLCKHAQWEIRQVAQDMGALVKEYFPLIDHKVMYCGRICNQCNKQEQ